MDLFQPLLDLAFERASALEANARIADLRERLGGAAPARSYEVVLPERSSLGWLSESLLPRLVYFLESVGARPPQAPGFFVSMFSGQELYFLHVNDVFAFASSALNLSLEDMLDRWGTHEVERPPARPSPPPLLPGLPDGQ
jgi:hypothetical protein